MLVLSMHHFITRKNSCITSYSLAIKLYNFHSESQFSSPFKKQKHGEISWMHNVGGENETEQLVQKSTPASPLAGRKEWAA